MKKSLRTSGIRLGFSLAEVIAALTIGAMVMLAVLKIYNQAERSAAAVTRNLERSRLPGEILQRITEDLDKIISFGSDTNITIGNRYTGGFQAAYLSITRTIKNNSNKEQEFEKIIWQSSYDYESADDGLVLYRSHSGIAMEDKVLDKNKENWERELFVPICSGITFFSIQVLTDKEPVYISTGTIPPGIIVTISFAEPFKKVDGTLDVPDDEKFTRTIAIDRTRKIRFDIVGKDFSNNKQNSTQQNTSDSKNLPPERPGTTDKVR